MEQIGKFKNDIYPFAREHYPDLIKELREKKDLTEEIETKIRKLYEEYLSLVRKETAEKESAEKAEDEGAEVVKS